MREIRSRDNATLKRLHALAESARDRRKHNETLLDGAHLIEAALDLEWPLKALFVSDSGLRRPEHQRLLQHAPAAVEQVLLSDALFAHISPVDTPSGLVALIELPSMAPPRALEADVLVLDGVQDPGNLGNILRTAAAAGLRDVLLTEGCAQAWAPRVLRAGMGAHFVLHIEERVDACTRLAGYPGCRVATALADDTGPLYALDLQGPVAWLFGAEGQGLSPALLAAADRCVTIPMAAGVESLNVGAAVAVCLFEQRRQRGLR
ncbi:TrmH family RNA methyltransferase [Thauera sp. WH-1]|uniref:TrmH family RNA methyltransferase n=1 Tax=Thauera sp. WH-1 TaxID=3398230 RepID=UPI0039FDE037